MSILVWIKEIGYMVNINTKKQVLKNKKKKEEDWNRNYWILFVWI